MTSADRRTAVGLFAIAFVTYAWFFNGGGWNQNAHFDLTRALVERQTLHIDGYRVNTGDIAWSNASGQWHAYINKPPGLSVLAAIPYAPLYFIERSMRVPVDTWKWMTVNAWIVTAFTCGIAGALIPAVLYVYGRRRLNASPLASAGVALAVAFGTNVLPFSTMLFAHVPAALFLLLAFVWLADRPLLAGVCAGMAGVIFFLCIPGAMVLLAGARSRLRFALGGLPFGILLAIYQEICFGSPFRTSVEASTPFTEKGLWMGVFRLPMPEALWGVTFSQYRGFLFFSPFLLLSFVGAAVMLKRRILRRELGMIAAITAIFIVSIAAFNGWSGGNSYGPRYLLPMIPLFAIPLFFVRGRILGGAAVALGVVAAVIQMLGTATDPMTPAHIARPVQDWAVPRFVAQNISSNEQAVDELIPHSLYKPGSHESEWASFNLGELVFGAGNPFSILPPLALLLFGVWRRRSLLHSG